MSYIYFASSWRNPYYDKISEFFEENNVPYYNFKKVANFNWSNIDKNWINWNVRDYKIALNHPLAEKGYNTDYNALYNARAVLLLLPCGKSAHLEVGCGVGMKKKTAIIIPNSASYEPELMYKMVDKIHYGVNQLLTLCEYLLGVEL